MSFIFIHVEKQDFRRKSGSFTAAISGLPHSGCPITFRTLEGRLETVSFKQKPLGFDFKASAPITVGEVAYSIRHGDRHIRVRGKSPERIIETTGCVGGVGLGSSAVFEFRRLAK